MKDRHLKFIETCQYCGGKPGLVKFGEPLYPYRADYGFMWICPVCRAQVGCHKNGKTPLGTLANREMQALRRKAHSLFDPIWKSGEMKRHQAYGRMAELLNIPTNDAHISQLPKEQLLKLIRCLELRRGR